jgi:hypothetical protein
MWAKNYQFGPTVAMWINWPVKTPITVESRGVFIVGFIEPWPEALTILGDRRIQSSIRRQVVKTAIASAMFTLLVAGCSTAKPAFLHPQFSSRIANINRVEVIMQSPAEIGLMNYRGGIQPCTNESALVTARLPELIAAQLQQRGFVISSNSLVENIDSNVRAQAQCWMEQWRTSGRCVVASNGQSDLSPEAKLLAAQAQADGVVLVRCWGKKNTEARQFREGVIESFGVCGGIAGLPGGQLGAEMGCLLLGGTAWLVTGAGTWGEFGNAATVEVVLIEGTTGDVLWAATDYHDFIGPALEGLAAETFQTFPAQ